MKHLPIIWCESINHKKHRYETVGDYFKDKLPLINKDCWRFEISKMSKAEYEFLVLIHEQIEWFLTQERGISEQSITKFDKAFEKEREERIKYVKNQPLNYHKSPNALHKKSWQEVVRDIENEEPGFDKNSPYLKEHTFATKIEKAVAKELSVDWEEYDKEVMSL